MGGVAQVGRLVVTSGTTVTDELPTALTFVSGSGGGFTCSASGPGSHLHHHCNPDRNIRNSDHHTQNVTVANNAPVECFGVTSPIPDQ